MFTFKILRDWRNQKKQARQWSAKSKKNYKNASYIKKTSFFSHFCIFRSIRTICWPWLDKNANIQKRKPSRISQLLQSVSTCKGITIKYEFRKNWTFFLIPLKNSVSSLNTVIIWAKPDVFKNKTKKYYMQYAYLTWPHLLRYTYLYAMIRICILQPPYEVLVIKLCNLIFRAILFVHDALRLA